LGLTARLVAEQVEVKQKMRRLERLCIEGAGERSSASFFAVLSAIDRIGQVMTPPRIVSYINDSVIERVEGDREGAEDRWKLVLAGLADGDGHARR
jgi:hypothetical protein